MAELAGEGRTYSIPQEAGSVGVSLGAVWVIPHVSPMLVRIDPVSGETRTFELPGVGAELAATDDELWMSLSEPATFEPNALVRVDPSTGAVTAHIEQPLVFPAVAGERVFASSMSGDIHVFHRTTGVPVDVVAEDVGRVTDWRVVDEGAWVVGSERAVRIDATSLAVDDVTKHLKGDLPLAFAGGRYWARTADAGLASFTPDLDDRRLYDVPGQVFPDAAVINDDVYVAYGGSSGGASMLLRIDTVLDKPTSVVKLPAGRFMEYGIDSDGACLWVPLLRMHEVYRACPTA